MLSPVEMSVAATAGLGGVTMLWGNIKGIFARIESLFIVKTELQGNMSNDFMDYGWVHFKSSPLGTRKFHSRNRFIRSKNRSGRVVFEGYGQHVTFWKGYRPIFVSFGQNKNDASTGTITFIRGTVNLEEILVEAANFHDENKHGKTYKSSRYYVKRCFGRKKIKNTENAEQSSKIGDPEYDSSEFDGQRPLFYSKDDLGVPTSRSPMDKLAYEDSVQKFYEEVSRWKNSKDWFKDKGLAWRFGAGLFGPPGTGKTSLARALGQALDMPIHSYDLTTMDNEELVNNWQDSLNESPCIVLLEDIDRIFDENKQIKTNKDKSPLTLDCLLNCISGVQPSDGILVLVTANDVTKLDPALGVPDQMGKSTRPGRLDRAVYVGTLNKQGREKIAARILSDNFDLIEQTVLEGEGETGAQFESRCSKLALERYWGGSKIYGQEFDMLTRAEVPGTGKTMDELRRQNSYDN